MKRTILALMCLGALASGLAGCGRKGDPVAPRPGTIEEMPERPAG
jgi:predicted small lipoprotein YifL